MKKVIIAIVIVAILIILLISSAVSKYRNYRIEKQKIEEENARPYKVYTSTDNSFSIELSKNYSLSEDNNSSDYLLSLTSNSNLGIHISKINQIENRSFYDIAKADRLAYSQSFSSYSNLSDLKELLVGDTVAYTYTFHYLDSIQKKPCYIQIIWLNIAGEFYCIDINFPLDDLSAYTNVVTETLSSFKKLN